MDWFQTIIIAIVEGLTEFLPVSSTGHMILTQGIIGIKSDDFVKAFTVIIQFGAIISVLVLYWKRFWQTWDFYRKLLIAFIPAAVIGFLAGDFIDLTEFKCLPGAYFRQDTDSRVIIENNSSLTINGLLIRKRTNLK